MIDLALGGNLARRKLPGNRLLCQRGKALQASGSVQSFVQTHPNRNIAFPAGIVED